MKIPMRTVTYRKILFLTLLLVIAAGPVLQAQAAPVRQDEPQQPDQRRTRSLYLPNTLNDYRPPRDPVVVGVYPQGWQGLETTMTNELDALSEWSGLKLTISGTFIGLTESYNNIYKQMIVPWESGYTPFVNLMTTATARDIARGSMDGHLRNWASAVRAYADKGERLVYIAPLPEMNGDWTSYGLDPTYFKAAFIHMVTLFRQEGVPDQSVRWVFAPNGWSTPDHEFEKYYPGDQWVQAVGFSAYNYGACPYPGHKPNWENVDTIALPYIERMRVMAPGKPIFLTQFATSSATRSGRDAEAKNEWFRYNYNILAQTEGLRGILYFNKDESACDLAFFTANRRYPGYRDAVTGPGFDYLGPVELMLMGK